ncbi:uncharacterized protein LOC100378530 [Saccoglossus kowalevskii]|uniref:Uncharacterized protein LOC100378530 n=1 Tax=Saccoglossus kowalevskii TaxID=10224 RepID=A0ABM0MI48_SACKO|nr:PREDICTED: uncharacterized protein LOC100378530 [Saccoglossus kowalevskii]
MATAMPPQHNHEVTTVALKSKPCPLCRSSYGFEQDNRAYEQWRGNLHRHGYSMNSQNLQTGLFLHQFTNSVSKALHKDHSRRHTKLTADELYAKAHPAIISTKQLTGRNYALHIHLPTNAEFDPTTVAKDLLDQSNTPLKSQLVREIGHQPHIKLKPSVADNQEQSYYLPTIMEITDKQGNSWKIQQQDKESKSAKSKTTTKLDLMVRIPPISPTVEKYTTDNHSKTTDPIEAVRQSNNANTEPAKLPQINKHRQLTWENDDDLSSERSVSLNNIDSDNKFHPLLTYSRSFQNRMSYSNYLRQMSLLNLHHQSSQPDRHDLVDALQIRGAKNAKNRFSKEIVMKSVEVYCPREELNDEDNLTVTTQRSDELAYFNYRNSDMSLPRCVEVGKNLPKDFSEKQKQKQKLRSIYPMYDWQLENRDRALENFGYPDYSGPRKMPSLESQPPPTPENSERPDDSNTTSTSNAANDLVLSATSLSGSDSENAKLVIDPTVAKSRDIQSVEESVLKRNRNEQIKEREPIVIKTWCAFGHMPDNSSIEGEATSDKELSSNDSIIGDTRSERLLTKSERHTSVSPSIKTLEIPPTSHSPVSQDTPGKSTVANTTSASKAHVGKSSVSKQTKTVTMSTKQVVFISPAAYVGKAVRMSGP